MYLNFKKKSGGGGGGAGQTNQCIEIFSYIRMQSIVMYCTMQNVIVQSGLNLPTLEELTTVVLG